MDFLRKITENLPAAPAGGKLKPMLALLAMGWSTSTMQTMIGDSLERLDALTTAGDLAAKRLADLQFECELAANRLRTLHANEERAAGKVHVTDPDALSADLADAADVDRPRADEAP